MQLNGMIHTAHPDKLAKLLADPEALSRIAPEGCQIGDKSGDAIAFEVRRKVGPLPVTLPGTLTFAPNDAGPGHVMTVRASHLIGGKVNLRLSLVPHGNAEGGTFLEWSGTLETSGLASRLLEGREEQAGNGLRELFMHLRDQLEGTARQAGGGRRPGQNRRPNKGQSRGSNAAKRARPD